MKDLEALAKFVNYINVITYCLPCVCRHDIITREKIFRAFLHLLEVVKAWNMQSYSAYQSNVRQNLLGYANLLVQKR